MTQKIILFLAVFSLFLFLSASSPMAQDIGAGSNKHTNSPPFLITGKLPHLTKLIMQQWENPALLLSDEQKEKLLVVRKETLSGAKKLSKEIALLEQQVVEGISAGETPDELHDTVKKVADLKTQATMLHLTCIYNTEKILNKDQLAVLTTRTAR